MTLKEYVFHSLSCSWLENHTLTHTHTHTHHTYHTHTHSQEYDNDAETLISAMTITPDDDELDKALKLSHVDMYNKKVTEREKRKL